MGLLTFNWLDSIARYARFKPRELKAALITIAVLAFALSFKQWGLGDQVNLAYGLSNFLLAVIIVAISFFLRQFFQKIVALGADYQAEYKMWSFGLLFALILVFITNGNVWFLIPGTVIVQFMPGHRLGWNRYGLNYFGIGVVSLAGPIGNILIAMIFRTLYALTNIQLLHTAFLFNLVWALWTILPVPPADGSRMFFGSRMVYMFGLAVVVSSAALLYSKIPLYLTIPGAFIIGWLWWLIYYLVWERHQWGGPY